MARDRSQGASSPSEKRIQALQRIRYRIDWNLSDLEDIRASAVADGDSALVLQCEKLMLLMSLAHDVNPQADDGTTNHAPPPREH